MSKLQELYKVKNRSKGTNWNVGAVIKKISFISRTGHALFTDAKNPGAALLAHHTEVEAVQELL
jgi:translation initiation factor IF-2